MKTKPRTSRTKNDFIQHNGFKEVYLYTKYGEIYKDHSVLIDDEDYEKLKQYKFGKVGDKRKYATIGIGGESKRLHRVIMGVENRLVVDHINGNGLDNRKINLRVCTYSQNNQNNKRKGYYYNKLWKKWIAYVFINYKKILSDGFDNEEDAKAERLKMEKKYYKQFSYHNR